MHHAFKLGDAEHSLELSRARHGYRLHLADRTLSISLVASAAKVSDAGGIAAEAAPTLLAIDSESVPVVIANRGDDVFIHVDGEAYHLHYEHPLERLAHQSHGAADDEVRAPMPGSLVSVAVKPGQGVARGEALLVMESMKMETTLSAPRDGVVAQVHFGTGQSFDRDAVLLTLESAA